MVLSNAMVPAAWLGSYSDGLDEPEQRLTRQHVVACWRDPMPRSEVVLQVLVASPSDVQAERDALEEAIRRLNIAWSANLGVRLELVSWDTHAYPGFGTDPQAVI